MKKFILTMLCSFSIITLLMVLFSCNMFAIELTQTKFDKLMKDWEIEKQTQYEEWKRTPSISSIGPSSITKSFNEIVDYGPTAIPFILKAVRKKSKQDYVIIQPETVYRKNSYLLSMICRIAKLKFKKKYLKIVENEKNKLLIDYNYCYISIPWVKGKNKCYSPTLYWWDYGRKLTPMIFANKYSEYQTALKTKDNKKVGEKFKLLQNMGIIILPNLLEKINTGDKTLIPMFNYLSDQKNLKTAKDCQNWWNKNSAEYQELLNYQKLPDYKTPKETKTK